MNPSETDFIITFISQCWPEFPITQQQLEHPTSDLCIEFYERFRSSMKGILLQAVGNAEIEPELPAQETPEDAIFSLLHFVNKYLKRVSEGDDCTLKLTDLYVPTAKRTKLRFKLLINLMMFYEQHLDRVKEIVGKRLQQVEDIKLKKQRKEQLRTALAKEAENLARSEDKLVKIQHELAKAHVRYENLKEKSKQSERTSKKLQHDLKTVVDIHGNKQSLLVNIKTDIQRLNEEIVTEESYNSLKDLKNSLTKKQEELDNEAASIRTDRDSKKTTVEHLSNVLAQIKDLDFESFGTLQKSIAEGQENLKAYDFSYREKSKQLEKVTESSLKYKELIKEHRQAIQAQTLKEATVSNQMQEELTQLKLEEEKEMVLQVKLKKEECMLIGDISNAEQKCANTREAIKNLNQVCTDTYTQIIAEENSVIKQFDVVMENLTKKMQKAVNPLISNNETPENEN